MYLRASFSPPSISQDKDPQDVWEMLSVIKYTPPPSQDTLEAKRVLKTGSDREGSSFIKEVICDEVIDEWTIRLGQR